MELKESASGGGGTSVETFRAGELTLRIGRVPERGGLLGPWLGFVIGAFGFTSAPWSDVGNSEVRHHENAIGVVSLNP